MLGDDDDKDSDDLNIFLNAIGEEPDDEAPMRKSSTSFNDINFFNFDDDDGDSNNPFQDFDDDYSNHQQPESPIFESPKVYIAPRVMISHQDSFSEDSRFDGIEDARILPISPRLKVPASPRAFVYQRSVESPRFGSPTGVVLGLIDTASPFESVKDAVSKFGGITDWKAHKIQTIERRKMVDEELENIQEAMPEYKREAEIAEEAKLNALKELESTKALIEELKLELEKAEKEEQQAKQDSELAQMRVEEMEQGVANEASVAVKAQLEVAKARQETAACELKSVREEIEMVCNEYESMSREKDLAAERAEVALLEAKEIERKMDGLSIELIAAKELLETAHTAHLEAEEKRFAVAMARDQDIYNWEKELKMVEDDIDRLNQEIRVADDVKLKLETASSHQYDLRDELAALTERSSSSLLMEKKSNSDIHAAVGSAKRELEEVKSNIEKAASEVKTLKIIAGSLQSEIVRERQDLAETKQREDACLVRRKDREAREEEFVDTAKKLEQATKEAEDAKFLAAAARDELRMAKELSEQAKTGMSTIESRVIEAKKEMEAARASEKLALAAIKALQETESAKRFEEISNSPSTIIISVEEYYELSKQAHESEEEANKRISEIVSQIEVAKEEESRILEKLEEVNREMSVRKEELKVAMGAAEKARDGKLGMEQELRKWRSENGKRRTEPEKSPARSSTEGRNKENGLGMSKSFAFGEEATSSSNIGGGTHNHNNNNGNLTPETKKKKKKFSLFPKVFMFLSRKKSHSHK